MTELSRLEILFSRVLWGFQGFNIFLITEKNKYADQTFWLLQLHCILLNHIGVREWQTIYIFRQSLYFSLYSFAVGCRHGWLLGILWYFNLMFTRAGNISHTIYLDITLLEQWALKWLPMPYSKQPA